MNSNHRDILYILSIIILLIFLKRCGESKQEAQNIIEAFQDTLTTERNRFGQQTASLKSIIVSNEKDFLKVKAKKNSDIAWLQDVVKKTKGKLQTALVLASKTSVSGSGKTKVLLGDTIVKDSIIEVWPTYEFHNRDPWHRISFKASRGNSDYEFETYDSLEVNISFRKTGFLGLGKREAISEAKNLNIYTSANSFRTVSKKVPEERFALVAGTGVSINPFASGEKIKPSIISVTLGYKIIGW